LLEIRVRIPAEVLFFAIISLQIFREGGDTIDAW